MRSETDARHRHRYRGRRLGDLPGGKGKHRHVHYRRSSALGRSCRRRTRRESSARRTLRNGSVWRKSARCASVETVQGAMGIYRLSYGLVRVAQASRLLRRSISTRLRLILNAAGRLPASRTAMMAVLLLALAPLSVLGAAKHGSAMRLPGYKAVPVHHRPLNHMIMFDRIN